jgi:hypothetical protein
MENETSNLFENEEFKIQFANLPPDQQETYKKAGQYMYSKNYEESHVDPQSRIDDAIDSLRRAFFAGLLPSHLSDDEIDFLKGVYGDEWYEEFGFSSSDCVEKKTPNELELSTEAVAGRNLFSDFVICNFDTEEKRSTLGSFSEIRWSEKDIEIRESEHVNIIDIDDIPGSEYTSEHVNIEEEYESGSIYNVWS